MQLTAYSVQLLLLVSCNVSIRFQALISWYSFIFQNTNFMIDACLINLISGINLNKVVKCVGFPTKIVSHVNYSRKWKKSDFKTVQFTFSGKLFLDRISRIRFIRTQKLFFIKQNSYILLRIVIYDNEFRIIAQIKGISMSQEKIQRFIFGLLILLYLWLSQFPFPIKWNT